MHGVMYVCLPLDEAKTSKEARKETDRFLDREGFAGEGGRFNCPPADWYQIGGGWSGDLQMARLDQRKVAKFEEKRKRLEAQIQQPATVEELDAQYKRIREQTRELWLKTFPAWKGELPDHRSEDKTDGYEDDAQIVDKRIYTRRIRGNISDNVTSEATAVVFTDGNIDDKPLKIVGKYWIVVVDYHY